jgi:hypothetical protein
LTGGEFVHGTVDCFFLVDRRGQTE